MTIRRTDDLRIQDVRPLIPAAILLEELPISERASNVVADARAALTNIVHGKDPRLAVIVGPCSIHDVSAALESSDDLDATVHGVPPGAGAGGMPADT